MRLLELNNSGTKSARALTIGNFDGVHLGHRAILDRLVSVALKKNLIPSVLTFQPHPAEFFAREKAPVRLYGNREKLNSFSEAGVAQAILLPFNRKYSKMLPEQFIRDILVSRLSVKWLLVGDDFRFGMDRRGDYDMLRVKGIEFGFEVEANSSVKVGQVRVSSTAVREALSRGDLEFAEQLLGKRYNVCGRVIHGDQIGRTLGYPTANIHFTRDLFPLNGIFMAFIDGPTFRQKPALVSVGKRPTVTNNGIVCVEVNILDFSGDLYGQKLNVQFVRKIRDQEAFASKDELIVAMKEDERISRKFFKLNSG